MMNMLFSGSFLLNPRNYVGNFNSDFNYVLKKVTNYVLGQGVTDATEAEFIAAKAVVYVIHTALSGKGSFPKTTDDWRNMGYNKAKKLVIDSHRAQKRSKVVFALDNLPKGKDGSEYEEAGFVNKASVAQWRADRQDAAHAEYARQVYRHLPALLAHCGVSEKAGRVFVDSALLKRPLPEVMKTYEMSAANVYVTIYRVKALLQEKGPSFIDGLGLEAA